MRNILLYLEFDGRSFRGWQVQPDTRTVQGEVEKILRIMFDEPELRVMGCGRTDAGVHALAMAVTFQAKRVIPCEGLVKGLNSQFPPDIVALSAREVPSGFCARHSSLGKHYRYQIWNHSRASTHARYYSWHIRDPLNIDALREGASYLVGRHDFSSFRASGCSSKHAVRDLWDIKIYQKGYFVFIEFYGSAFVRHMVRNLVGSLHEVGLNNHPPEWIHEVLRARNRQKASITAPANGLFMVSVDYKLPPLKNVD